jgi:hypothetical protein
VFNSFNIVYEIGHQKIKVESTNRLTPPLKSILLFSKIIFFSNHQKKKKQAPPNIRGQQKASTTD